MFRIVAGVPDVAICSDLRQRSFVTVATPALRIVVEKHSDGYVAYPLGLARGVIVGQGDNYEDALADVRSAIAFHLETFGPGSLASSEGEAVLEAFVSAAVMPA